MGSFLSVMYEGTDIVADGGEEILYCRAQARDELCAVPRSLSFALAK